MDTIERGGSLAHIFWKSKITAKKDKDVYTQKGYCTWYLRDPSEMIEGNWTGVTPSGELDLFGGDFKRSGDKGVRPAIYVKLS